MSYLPLTASLRLHSLLPCPAFPSTDIKYTFSLFEENRHLRYDIANGEHATSTNRISINYHIGFINLRQWCCLVTFAIDIKGVFHKVDKIVTLLITIRYIFIYFLLWQGSSITLCGRGVRSSRSSSLCTIHTILTSF